jgi:Trk K+ transport system NAD-binding subunit
MERDCMHPDEQSKDLGDAQILILGMGRTGTAAYEHLAAMGKRLVGLDADTYKAEAHQQAGRNVFFADAEDVNFWGGVDLTRIESAILAMDDIEAKLISARMLRRRGFTAPIISHSLYEDHRDRLMEAGATHTYLTMSQAGVGLAEQALRAMPDSPQIARAVESTLPKPV